MRFLQIDFMRRRNLWFAISGVVILVSAISLATRSLNLGIDFKGGVQTTFTTKKPTPISSVRDQTNAIGQRDAVVQGRGKTYGSESYKSFQIRLKKLSAKDQNTLTNRLTDNVNAEKLGTKNVSSSFGRQIAKSAVLAILFSLLIITLYISVRFKGLAFAVPVIAARMDLPARTSSLIRSNTTTFASAATPIVRIRPAKPGRVSVTLKSRSAA